MVVDHTSRGKGKGKGNDKGKSNGKGKSKGKSKGKDSSNGNGKSKGKGTKPTIQRVLRVRRKRALRTRLLVTSKPRQNSQRGERCKVDSDAGKEFVFAVENAAKDVSPSQSDCEVNEDGLVMTDSGASVGCRADQFDSRLRRGGSAPRQRKTPTTESVKSGLESETT